jgi:hemerythrin-like metal-binding protein
LKRLLALGSAVVEASSDGQAREAVTDLPGAIRDESIRHFAREEDLMREAGYPLLHEHHDPHNRLTSELHLFIQQYEAGHLSPERLTHFLVDWLVSHIVRHDRKFRQYRANVRAGHAAADGALAAGARPQPG